MKRKLWTLLLALGAALALCVGAGATDFSTGWDEVTNSTITLESGKQYYLSGDVTILQTITVNGTVTLDLNGHVLKYESTTNGSVIVVEGGVLTITDSSPNMPHYFTVDNSTGLWVWDSTDTADEGKKTVHGGIITGGRADQGGGVYVKTGGNLTMTGGNIVGCSATDVGGGVYLNGMNGTVDQTTFTMTGGSITGCLAANTDGGGGVNVAQGTFTMSGGSITECTVSSFGGGVHIRNGGSFTMTGGAIQNCKSDGSRSNGGGVYVGSGQFTMNGGSIAGCRAKGTSGNEEFARGGGVYNCGGVFTMNDGTIASDCTADGSGGGVYNEKTLYANGGEIAGNVVNGIPGQTTGTISGSGGTKFSGKVTNNKGDSDSKSVIECGIFTGTVINDGGTIKNADDSIGPKFTGTVTNKNDGTITGGDFSKATSFTDNGSTSFTVTFDADGGNVTPVTIHYGGKLTEPSPAPTKDGYTFGGWYYTEDNAEKEWDFDTDTVTRTMTLTAKWTPNTYQVVYYADSYTNEKDHQYDTKIHGQPLKLKGAIFTRSGYTQTGWATGQVDYALGGTYTTDTEVILSPVWTANPPAPSYDDSEPTYSVSAPTAENGKVAVSPRYAERGERVTVTLTPDEGFELDSLTVTDSRGDALELTDLGGGKYRFTMPARRVEVKASFVKTVEVSPFDDVAIDAYYYEAVKWAVKKGITDGMGDSLFAPGQPCTRAQIVTFLWRAAGSPEPKDTASGMTDVLSGSYYEKAVAWAIENGITTGTGEGKFSPDATCTRAQAVTFLARALNAKASGKAEFSDVPTGSYFAEAVAWAAANGVTEGVVVGLFAPDNDCTRGQIVTFLYRAYNR